MDTYFLHLKLSIYSDFSGWLEAYSGGFVLAFDVMGGVQLLGAFILSVSYCCRRTAQYHFTEEIAAVSPEKPDTIYVINLKSLSENKEK